MPAVGWLLRLILRSAPGSWQRLLSIFATASSVSGGGEKKKPTARFASGGGFETLLVLLAVSDLAGSARSLSLNNGGGRRRVHGRHRHDAGANRDGERQTHAMENSTECSPRKRAKRSRA